MIGDPVLGDPVLGDPVLGDPTYLLHTQSHAYQSHQQLGVSSFRLCDNRKWNIWTPRGLSNDCLLCKG